MVSKLLYDEKVFTCDGTWVVREGETIDQAKARVDDRERERLREQAENEYQAEREREKEGLEKLCAEEDAMGRTRQTGGDAEATKHRQSCSLFIIVD